MDLNFSAFQEPRGVMRILHFVFSICAFATITGYVGYINYKCTEASPAKDEFSYPFDLKIIDKVLTNTTKPCSVSIVGDFSSDAKFFVATGVLAMLYSLGIMAVYAKFDEMYKSNTNLPVYDFIATVIFGVLWISSSSAWATGLSGLKNAVNPTNVCTACNIVSSGFSSLNISVIFGFLNFFLWAADLWFLYKETPWFQGAQPQLQQPSGGV